jgi:ABC-type sugar transport system permease subunit
MTRWRDNLTVSTKQAMWAWGFLALPVLFFVLVRFAPSLYAFTLAFTNWNILGTPRFVGWENFIRLWNDPVFWQAFANMFGLAQQPFLNSTEQALPAVLAVAIWAGLGFNVVIFLAGLRAIPESYYEAARIDGVSRTAILWEITLPLLRPTIIFLVVISSIGFLRIFDQVFNMTTDGDGGPLNSTTPLVLMIYRTAFKTFQMGYATALTVVLFLVMLAVTLLQLWVTRKR